MKYTFWIALAALAFWYYSGSDERNETARLAQVAVEKVAEARAKEKAARQEKITAIHKELAKKHNALTPSEWAPKELAEEDKYGPDAHPVVALNFRLVNDEGRPALIEGKLLDAYPSNGKYFLRLTTSYSFYRHSWESYIDFTIDCPKEIINEVMKNERQTTFAVVAKFDTVKKIDYAIGGWGVGEDVELRMELSNSYTAKGSCIEIRALPS